MGLLRLILAFSVVAGHGAFYRPFFFINAGVAVICFFMISGFYMALVIDEKYDDESPHWRWRFMASRALRLYPTYFISAAFAALVLIGTGKSATLGVLIGDGSAQSLGLSALNLTLVGQDWLIVATESGLAHIASPILVPQAWSIALELTLYVLAAFLLTGRATIMAALVVSAALRVALEYLGFSGVPWGNKFILHVAVFFFVGAATYIAYKRIAKYPVEWRVTAAAGIVVFLLVAGYRNGAWWSEDAASLSWPLVMLYVGVAALIPLLFSLTRSIKIDRFLGELSYPVYLLHIALFTVATHWSFGHRTTTIFVGAAALGLSALIVILVERPLYTARTARFSTHGASTASTSAPMAVNTATTSSSSA